MEIAIYDDSKPREGSLLLRKRNFKNAMTCLTAMSASMTRVHRNTMTRSRVMATIGVMMFIIGFRYFNTTSIAFVTSPLLAECKKYE